MSAKPQAAFEGTIVIIGIPRRELEWPAKKRIGSPSAPGTSARAPIPSARRSARRSPSRPRFASTRSSASTACSCTTTTWCRADLDAAADRRRASPRSRRCSTARGCSASSSPRGCGRIPKTIDGGYTSNSAADRKYALDRSQAGHRHRQRDRLPRHGALAGPRRDVHPRGEGRRSRAVGRIVDAVNAMLEHDPKIRILGEMKPNEPMDQAYCPTVGHFMGLAYRTADPARVGVLIESAHSILAGLDPSDDMAYALWHGKLWSVHLNDQNGLKYDQDKTFGSVDLRRAFNKVWVLERGGLRRLRRPRRQGHADDEGRPTRPATWPTAWRCSSAWSTSSAAWMPTKVETLPRRARLRRAGDVYPGNVAGMNSPSPEGERGAEQAGNTRMPDETVSPRSSGILLHPTSLPGILASAIWDRRRMRGLTRLPRPSKSGGKFSRLGRPGLAIRRIKPSPPSPAIPSS